MTGPRREPRLARARGLVLPLLLAATAGPGCGARTLASAEGTAASATPAHSPPRSSGTPFVPSGTWWELGDSITRGNGSTPSAAPTGYRKPLWTWTQAHGGRVTFIGSSTTGDWPDARHDGHPGYTIEQLQQFVRLEWRTPNLPGADIVIFMAGTNNVARADFSLPESVTHYRELLDALVAGHPETRVLVTTITPIDDARVETNIEAFNAAIAREWDDFDGTSAQRVVRADAFRALGPWSTERFVGEHPNNAGYELMAAEFERALTAR